jgi:hypothetical protein
MKNVAKMSEKTVGWLVPAAIVIGSLIIFSTPIRDGDAFWHLATGRWMVEHLGLMHVDPFLFTSNRSDISRSESSLQNFIMKQNWGSQVLMYGLWKSLGYGGIVLMRCLSYAAALLISWFWTKKRCGGTYALLVVLLAIPLLLSFPSERPQLFSFVFIPLLFWCLDEQARQKKNTLTIFNWLPVIVMPIWANMHGSFILGFLLLALFSISHAVTRTWKAAGLNLLAMILSFVNPSGFDAVLWIVSSINSSEGNSEFISPIRAAMDLHIYYPTFWLALFAVGFALTIRFRSMPFPVWVASASISLLALSAIRYIPIFILTLPPVIAMLPPVRPLIANGAVLLLTIFSMKHVEWHQLFSNSPETFFPSETVGYIKSHSLPDNVFNLYEWGGFLELENGSRKFFIDGRSLDPSLNQVYDQALAGEAWRDIFSTYNISTVVIPAICVFNGLTHPLAEALYNAEDWSLVHADPQGVVFVKSEKASHLTLTDRKEYLGHILALTAKLPDEMRRYPLYWITRGNAYFQIGNLQAAKASYEEALKINPGDRDAAVMLERIGAMGVYR